MGVKYSYQLKLRDTGASGFLLPPKSIKPTGEEVFSALIYFGNYLLSNKGVESIENSPSAVEIMFSRPSALLGDTALNRANAEQLDLEGGDSRFDLK